SDGAGDILGAGAPVALVMAPVLDGTEAGSLAHEQSARALRGVDLVAADRVQIHAQRLDVSGNPPGRLHTVRVKNDTRLPSDTGDLRNRLDCAQLVVGVHHRNQ